MKCNRNILFKVFKWEADSNDVPQAEKTARVEPYARYRHGDLHVTELRKRLRNQGKVKALGTVSYH